MGAHAASILASAGLICLQYLGVALPRLPARPHHASPRVSPPHCAAPAARHAALSGHRKPRLAPGSVPWGAAAAAPDSPLLPPPAPRGSSTRCHRRRHAAAAPAAVPASSQSKASSAKPTPAVSGSMVPALCAFSGSLLPPAASGSSARLPRPDRRRCRPRLLQPRCCL